MYELDSLADEDVTEERKPEEEHGKRARTVEGQHREIVDLESIGHVPDALSIIVGVRQDDDLVPLLYKALGNEVNVGFNAASVWKEEVTHHCNTIAALFLDYRAVTLIVADRR